MGRYIIDGNVSFNYMVIDRPDPSPDEYTGVWDGDVINGTVRLDSGVSSSFLINWNENEINGAVTQTWLNFTLNGTMEGSIEIVDSGMNPISDASVSVGYNITGYTSIRHFVTGTHMHFADCTWTVSNADSHAWGDNATGNSSTFFANTTTGTAQWTADHGLLSDTVAFTILPPQTDYIVIVNQSGTGQYPVASSILNVGDEVSGFSARFNDTAGYIGDVVVTWSVLNGSGTDARTLPTVGTGSSLRAGLSGGWVNWIASDGSGHECSVNFTINHPRPDDLVITDGGDGAAVQNQWLPTNAALSGNASLYNDTAGYIGLGITNWSAFNAGSSASVSQTHGTGTIMGTGNAAGTALFNASYYHPAKGWLNDSVKIDVLPPSVDYINLTDAPDGIQLVGGQLVVGAAAFANCSAYNSTFGYLGVVAADWTVEGAGASLVSVTPSGSARMDADAVSGPLWLNASFGAVMASVRYDVLPPTVDAMEITDVPAGIALQNHVVHPDDVLWGNASAYNDTIGYIGQVSVNWTASAVGASPSLAYTSGFLTWVDTGSAAGLVWLNSSVMIGGRWDNDSVLLDVTDWTVDWIDITDVPGGSSIANGTLPVGASMWGNASAYNATHGYLGAVSVSWTLEGVQGVAGSLISSFGPMSGLNGGVSGGRLYWNATHQTSGTTDSVAFTILPPSVDEVRITEIPGGPEISDSILNVGVRIAGNVSLFNDTIGYFDTADAEWTVTNDASTNASSSPQNGTYSRFYSGWHGGVATWRTAYMGKQDAVSFIINEPEIDELRIVGQPGIGGPGMLDRVVSVGMGIDCYAAGYNTTIGYVADMIAAWSIALSNASNAEAAPLNGVHTQAYTGIAGGNFIVSAVYGSLPQQTVAFSVTPPSIDYIRIVNNSGTGLHEIGEGTMVVGTTIRGYAAGYNVSVGYMDEVAANWSVVNNNSTAIMSITAGGVSTRLIVGSTNGTVLWKCEYMGLEDDVVLLVTGAIGLVTIQRFVEGYVILKGEGLGGQLIEVANNRTGEAVMADTDSSGHYNVELSDFVQGWLDSDEIMVTCQYGDEEVSNHTQFSEVVTNYRLDVTLHGPSEPPADDDVIWLLLPLVLIIFLILVLLFWFIRRQSDDENEQ
jgi:hypothetical protein